MNITELRIGNLVSYNGTEVHKVVTISENDFSTKHTGTYYFNTYIESGKTFSTHQPIPLNAEWFIKFGWRTRDGSWYQCPIHYWNYNTFHKELTLHEANDGDSFDVKIEYVHQLQNLYFAITGKELEYK